MFLTVSEITSFFYFALGKSASHKVHVLVKHFFYYLLDLGWIPNIFIGNLFKYSDHRGEQWLSFSWIQGTPSGNVILFYINLLQISTPKDPFSLADYLCVCIWIACIQKWTMLLYHKVQYGREETAIGKVKRDVWKAVGDERKLGVTKIWREEKSEIWDRSRRD